MTLGLALSSGAALGAAHIGVVEVLDAAGIRPDVISGTSIGAVVGAAYVTGQLGVLRELALNFRRWQMVKLADFQILGSGLIGGARIEELLEDYFGDTLIEDLEYPFAVVASDLATGRARTMRSGSLVRALRASMSIPGIFKPSVIDGAVLVDGGLVQPMPVAACRELGAERLIAVDLTGDCAGRVEAIGIRSDRIVGARTVDMVLASVLVMMNALTHANLAVAPADIVMTPKIGDFAPHDFDRAGDLIERGRAAARDALPEIRALGIGNDRGGESFD